MITSNITFLWSFISFLFRVHNVQRKEALESQIYKISSHNSSRGWDQRTRVLWHDNLVLRWYLSQQWPIRLLLLYIATSHSRGGKCTTTKNHNRIRQTTSAGKNYNSLPCANLLHLHLRNFIIAVGFHNKVGDGSMRGWDGIVRRHDDLIGFVLLVCYRVVLSDWIRSNQIKSDRIETNRIEWNGINITRREREIEREARNAFD